MVIFTPVKPILSNGFFLALLGFFCLSIGDMSVKKLSENYNVLYVAFFANIVTSAAILAFAFGRRTPKILYQTYCLKLQVLRAFIFLGLFLLFIFTMSQMPMTEAYALMLTQPFMLAIMAHLFLKEKIGLHRILAIIGGFAGMIIVLRPGMIDWGIAPLTALLCAFLFGLTNLVVKFMDPRDHWASYIFYTMAIQTPILGLILFWQQDFSIALPPFNAWIWFGLGGGFYMLGMAIIPSSLRRIDAALFGATEFSILIWGALFGYLVFSDLPDKFTIIGALVIVASGLYLVYRERQAHLNGPQIKNTDLKQDE